MTGMGALDLNPSQPVCDRERVGNGTSIDLIPYWGSSFDVDGEPGAVFVCLSTLS